MTIQGMSPESCRTPRCEGLTQQRLKELFYYNPDTGVFIRLSPVIGGNGSIPYKGATVAGGVKKSNGYVSITIDGQRFYAHRLAFLYMEGSLPSHCVDHIDGVKTNNQWANLRDVTSRVNAQNLRSGQKGKGLLGVSRYGKNGKWRAGIATGGKRKHLGVFDTEEQAYLAYVAAKRIVHKDGNTL